MFCGIPEWNRGHLLGAVPHRQADLGARLEVLARTNSWVSVILDKTVKKDPHYTESQESAGLVCRPSLKK